MELKFSLLTSVAAIAIWVALFAQQATMPGAF